MKNHRIFKKNREYDQDEYIRLLYLTSMCVCAYPHAWVPTKSLQYCQLCDPMDCSPPLSVGFSRPECQGGLPSPPPGDPPDSGVEPVSPVAPALQVDSLPLSHNREPMYPHINKQFLDWYQPGVWEFNSVLTLSTRRLNQDYTRERLMPSPRSTSDPNSKPRLPVLLTEVCTSEIPVVPSLGWTNLLEQLGQLKNSGKPIYSLDNWLITKDIKG